MLHCNKSRHHLNLYNLFSCRPNMRLTVSARVVLNLRWLNFNSSCRNNHRYSSNNSLLSNNMLLLLLYNLLYSLKQHPIFHLNQRLILAEVGFKINRQAICRIKALAAGLLQILSCHLILNQGLRQSTLFILVWDSQRPIWTLIYHLKLHQ